MNPSLHVQHSFGPILVESALTGIPAIEEISYLRHMKALYRSLNRFDLHVHLSLELAMYNNEATSTN